MDSDFFDSYSITACRIDCETRYLVENCNCRMVHMPGQTPKLSAQACAALRAYQAPASMEAGPAGFSLPHF